MEQTKERFVIRARFNDEPPILLTASRSIPHLREAAKWKHCHDLSGVGELRCAELMLEGSGLAEILDDASDAIERLGGFRKMRAVVLPEHAAINTSVPAAEQLFLALKRVDDCANRGWLPGGRQHINALVQLSQHTDDVGSLLDDLLFDLSIANSQPFRPTVTAAIKSLGRDAFYKSKVKYLLDNGYVETKFGIIDPACGYVCLSSAIENKEDSIDCAMNTIALWDDFLSKSHAAFFPKAAEVAATLKGWSKIGGQLPLEENLAAEVASLKPGIWVLLFVKKSWRDDDKERIMTHLGGIPDSDSLNGHYRIFRYSDITRGIQDLIRDGNLSPLKFLIGG